MTSLAPAQPVLKEEFYKFPDGRLGRAVMHDGNLHQVFVTVAKSGEQPREITNNALYSPILSGSATEITKRAYERGLSALNRRSQFTVLTAVLA